MRRTWMLSIFLAGLTTMAMAATNMSIASPAGGESYVVGQSETFAYNGKTRFKTLLVELTRDGGNTWTTIGRINNKIKDAAKRNKIDWNVSGPSAANCMVRMTGTYGSKAKPKTAVVRSGMFSIAPAEIFGAGALPPGPDGPQGPAGPQGPQGLKGDTGAAGPAGANGVQGIQGDVGPMGPAGADGAQGPQGVAGPQGDIGPMGPTGADGATGPAGPQGAAGPQGPQGDIGSMGPQGATGPMGPAGPQGPAGTDGAVGPIGPQGPQGDAGVAGPQGPQGPAGADGTQGPAGPAGATGPAGPQGPQGVAGPAGPQGPAGLQGPTGPQGPSGPQGPIGPNGSATVSYINTASTANAVLNSSKHAGTLVITDPNIRGPNNAKGRSQIFFSFSTAASTAGTVSLSGSNLADGTVTVQISTQNYALQTTDTIDYQIINAQ